MNSNASAVAAGGRLNHVKVVVLTLVAALVIMLIGITARATDDTNGYGISGTGPVVMVSDRNHRSTN
jgi:hypothetical protein